MKRFILVLTGVLGLLVLMLLLLLDRRQQKEYPYRGGKQGGVDASQWLRTYDSLEIRNVNILNAACDSFYRGNVLLVRGRIAAISDTADRSATAQVIDGSGRFLLPGFTDTHVHLEASRNDLLLYLVNGVTSVWEMFGGPHHLAWRDSVATGNYAPRLYVATPKLGRQQNWHAWLNPYYRGEKSFFTEGQAEGAVEAYAEAGYDAIKLGSFVDQRMYEVLCETAEAMDLPVVGHLNTDAGFEGLLRSSQREVAHIEEITRLILDEFLNNEEHASEGFIAFAERRSAEVARLLHEKGIVVSSTLAKSQLNHSDQRTPNDTDTLNAYVNPEIRNEIWSNAHGHGYGRSGFDSDSAYHRAMYLANAVVTRALIENIVTIIPGSDANMRGMYPGFSFHQELMVLKGSGLTEAEIIRAATQKPYDFIGKGSGIIEVDGLADLVLLQSNPLEDIGNSSAIEMVFFGEYYMDKEGRRALLEAVKAAYSVKS